VGTKTLIESAATKNHLNAAVDRLRRANQIDLLPQGLLSRAWLRCLHGDLDAPRTDLNEAWEIADVESAKNQAIADLRSEVASLAIGAAEVVVQHNLDAATQTQLVEQYIQSVANQCN
jgi:hypothetical protein